MDITGAHRTVSRGDHGTAIVHVLSSLAVGGMERVVLRLAAAQRDRGCTVSILALRPGSLTDEARERALSASVLHSGRVARLYQTLRYFGATQPDIVHVHNATSLHYAVWAKAVSRARIVVTMHGNLDTHGRLGTALEWKLTDAGVAVSEAARTTLNLPGYTGALTVIHNGIDPAVSDASARARVRNDLGLGNRIVGIQVARIDGRKGHLTLLDSLAQLRRANVIVLIVGDGAQRAAIEERARQLGLDAESVRFLGNRSDIDALLEAADFFVLPSTTEGLPMSVLEAMSHSLPVVATRVGGLPELIESEVEGLLVPASDPSALASAIERLISSPGMIPTLGEAGRARVLRDFSLSTMVDRYQALYKHSRGGDTPPR